MTEQHQHPDEPGEPVGAGGPIDGMGGSDQERAPGSRRASRRKSRRRGGIGCLIALVVLVLLVGAALVGLTKGLDWVKDQFGDAEDYSGPGKGSVSVVVNPGDSTTDIGNALEGKDVVASLDAFKNAAAARPDEAGLIQPGTYDFRKQMKAADAFAILVDSDNRIVNRVTVPEGLRVVDIVDLLADKTDFSKKQFNRALGKPAVLGLPAYAHGDAEGYLFPATYEFGPKDKPVDMLKAMVTRWQQASSDSGLVKASRKLGYSPHELMTIASLVEAEGRGDDMPKIARVIYNRLQNPGKSGTIGRLEIDATVNYALGRNLGVALTAQDLKVDSPYNTRRNPGLPPGPIEAPGDDAIDAALHPAKGDWYFYVTVDLKTGETKFAKNYEEFQRYKAEYTEYCQTSDAC